MSKSTLSPLLWAFLIIGVAGLVLLILAAAGVATAGIISGIGIILLAAGIVGAGFIIISPRRTDSSSIDKAAASTANLPTTPAPTPVAATPVAAAAVAPAPATAAPAPAAPAPVAPAEPVAPPAPPVEATPEPPAPVAAAPEPPAPVEPVSEPAVEDAREFPHPAEVASEFSGPAEVAPVAAVAPAEPPAPVAVEAGTPKQSGFASVRRIGSSHSSGAASFNGDEWVFALASSPTVQHTYRIRARRNGGSAAEWFKGGGIVDVLIDNVPTGQFVVIPNKKSAKEDVVNGSTYRVEMHITSDGLTASTLDTLVTVDGIPMIETS